MMKILILLLVCIQCISLNAADLYVNNSGAAGTYTTIQSAINASASGDNIYVSPYGLYTEDLTIAKDLTIASSVSGTSFNVDGTLDITGYGTGEIRFVGMTISQRISGIDGTSNLTNMTNVIFIDCDLDQVYFWTTYFINLNIYFSRVSNSVYFSIGNLIGNEFKQLVSVRDGPNVGIPDTIKIIGNKFSENSYLNWDNDDYYFMISNNFFNRDRSNTMLSIYKSHYNSSVNHIIGNNTLFWDIDNWIGSYPNSSGMIRIESGPANLSNIHLISNAAPSYNGASIYWFFDSGHMSRSNSEKVKGYYNITGGVHGSSWQNITGNVSNSNVSAISNAFPNNNVTIDNLGIINSTKWIENKGIPSIEYYDIDMTPNDPGTYGGPHSIENYWNTATGKARVINLDLPVEIWTGQTPQIKADAVHTK